MLEIEEESFLLIYVWISINISNKVYYLIETETQCDKEVAPEWKDEEDCEFDDPANDIEEGLDGQTFLMDLSRTQGGGRYRWGRGGRGPGNRPARGGAAPG